ncbi:MAG: F0F1 ATP synthase subunit delta [Gammaproteobacteria bacterium]|nr:F0F1 ATP synthase subunit delta [Gammaproteobacteria bacterium]
MAESITVARPYTKAAFETALAQGDLGSWSEFLNLAAAVVADADLATVLDNPELTAEQKSQLVTDVISGSHPVSQQAQNFLNLLAENKRLSLLPEVSNLYETLKANQEQSVDVSIVSAFDLGSEQQDKLAQALNAMLSREINITSTTDESLLGGVIVHAGDLVIDGSVKGKLGKLAEAMNA